MARETFKELKECVDAEVNGLIKDYEALKEGFLRYEPWVNALNDNIPESVFTPKITDGSWLYVDFPFQSFRESLGIKIRIVLGQSSDNKVYASFHDSTSLITFPSKEKANKFLVKRTCPDIVKYYELILKESINKDDFYYIAKTFTEPESLIKYLKAIRESVKNDNYVMLKAYFEDERTEKALREITEC